VIAAVTGRRTPTTTPDPATRRKARRYAYEWVPDDPARSRAVADYLEGLDRRREVRLRPLCGKHHDQHTAQCYDPIGIG
jgi:hypothetical protein